MRYFTNTQHSWLLLLLCIFAAACNEVNDPQPPDQATIPDQVVRLFEQHFAGAENTTLKVVQKDRIWEAYYSRNAEDFYVALDSNSVLASYKLLGAAVPDSVVKAVAGLSISGGSFSDFCLNLTALTGAPYRVRYKLDGADYVVRGPYYAPFTRAQSIRMDLYSKFDYSFTSVNKLPEAARSYLMSQGYKFVSGTGFVGENNKLRFLVTAQNTLLRQIGIEFDADGTMVYSDYGSQKVYIQKNDLPVQIQRSLDHLPSLKDYSFLSGSYNKSYQVDFLKGKEYITVSLNDQAAITAISYTSAL